MSLLEVKNLGISFGGLRAVDGFHISIEKGQLYGLIGPNGAGKTTVFNMLSGGITPPLYGFLRAIRNKGDFFNFSSVCPKSASLMPLSSDAILKISLS